jgi:Dolichyl-phosphate-mannose-protein mannosyltransferase
VLAWVLLVVGLVVLARLAFKGWIPHDEGTLGQAATRVLGGEVPHVDFHDTYGGLQAYAHAGVFSLIGESIRSLRIANIAMAATAAFASFTIVRRVQPIVVAASAGVAAMLVGFAVYPASMPSWWNVALGLASAALVLRWLDKRNSTLLAAAGLLTGVSFLVKLTGAYLAAAIVLYLIILASSSSPRRKVYVGIGCVVPLAFGLLLAGAPSLGTFLVLLVPLVVVTLFGFRAALDAGISQAQSVPLRSVIMFSVFVLLPVAFYVALYVLSGNGASIVTGWLTLPQLRLDVNTNSMAFPVVQLLLLVLIYPLIYLVKGRLGFGLVTATVLILSTLIAVIAWEEWWNIAMMLIMAAPLVVAAGLVRRAWRHSVRPEHLLTALMLATFAFVQFPYGNTIYALYLVPLIVTVLGVWIVGRDGSRALAVVLLLVAGIVAVQLERGSLYLSAPLADPVEMVALEAERGGIDIPAREMYYAHLIDHLARYEGAPIYAGPDSPEIYFLTGTTNPTPVFFEMLAESWTVEDVEGAVSEGELSAVVVKDSSGYSLPLPQTFVDVVRQELPNRTSFGPFDVFEDMNSP